MHERADMGNWGRGRGGSLGVCWLMYSFETELSQTQTHTHTHALRLGGRRLAQHPGAGDDRLALATRLVRLLDKVVRRGGLAVWAHLLLARLRATLSTKAAARGRRYLLAGDDHNKSLLWERFSIGEGT